MVLSDFLSRLKHDDSNPHEIIPFSFNIQHILQSNYFNIGEENVGTYLVQTRSKAKSNGISLPEVHGIGKGLDPNVSPEKQVIKPIITSEAKEIYQIKPRLGQSNAGLRWQIKTLMPPQISKPTVELTEKPMPHIQNIEHLKVTLKVPLLESSIIHDKITPIPDYAIPQTKSGDNSGTRMVKRKTIENISREIPMYQDPIYRPLPKATEKPLQEVPIHLSDLDPEISTDFKENSLFQEGVISETYQRCSKSYFQYHKNWIV